MDNSFLAYLERLELLGFFSGFPLVYAIVKLFTGKIETRNRLQTIMHSSLPMAYALTGTLYLGLILRNAYPDLSLQNIFATPEEPLLRIWGLSCLLFWIPIFSRNIVFSLLHSLVFFYFILRDLLNYLLAPSGGNQLIKNDMSVYGDSLLIIVSCWILIVGFKYLFIGYRRRFTS